MARGEETRIQGAGAHALPKAAEVNPRGAESKAARRDGRQEGGGARTERGQSVSEASAVLNLTKQGASVRDRDWSWVEASVWNERMLAALGNGVRGGKWFWPNAFFADLGLFTMAEAHAQASRPR